VSADGGPPRLDVLMPFVADVTGVELTVTDVPESSALGAAMAGMLGLGWVASPAEFARLPRSLRSFTPRMPRADVDRLLAGWRDAVRRVVLEPAGP
jgi:glycerol kinase